MGEIPIRCLRKETKDLISFLLNPKKIITNKDGLSRDWHGLAELCGIGGEKIPNIQRDCDPTLRVLEVWSEKNKNESTVGKLLSFLETLDRFDVIEDITPYLDKDVEYYKANPNGFKAELQDIDDVDIITYDDAERKREGLPPQLYDAFVLFDDDDIDFATEIVNMMEGQYSMKLCVKDRDVVGGEHNHDSVIRLIVNRCHRVIVVVSPSFLKSPTNKYFYALASMEGIEKEKRKIIPCIYKKCPDLPIEFRAYYSLDYMRKGQLFNFWDQLNKSLKVVLSSPSPRRAVEPSPDLQKNEEKKEKHSEIPRSHVTFAVENTSESPEETKDSTVEAPVQESLDTPSSCPSIDQDREINKKNSLFNNWKKLLPKKQNKIEEKTEVPQNNKKKKYKFWKRNKYREAALLN